MTIQKKTVGTTLATAAAAMFIAGAALTGAPSAAQADGVNAWASTHARVTAPARPRKTTVKA